MATQSRIAYDARKAAQAVSLTEPEFRDAVRAGVMPQPKSLMGKSVWLHDEIVSALKGDDDRTEPDYSKL